MVKLRAGKKKQAAVKDSGIVTSEFKPVHRFPKIPTVNRASLRTKKGLMVLGTVVALLLVIVGIILYMNRTKPAPRIEGQTEAQYISKSIKDLEAKVPDSSASQSERIKYYDQLVINYQLAGNYQKAVDTFMKRADIQSADLDYMDYTQLATFYISLEQKENAIAALDKAISLLPSAVNEETGYDPAVMQSQLEQMKAEQQK